MSNQHLTDIEIQQYVLQKSNSPIYIVNHMQHCSKCSIKAEQYDLLFSAIKKHEKLIFDFNLADLVMEKLPKPQQKIANENWVFYFAAPLVIFSICAIFYFGGTNLLHLFTKMEPLVLGLITATVSSILIFLCIELYAEYRDKRKILNFY